MTPVGRWWSDLSRAERFDVSLRWPLYALIAVEPLFALLLFFSAAEPAGLRMIGFLVLAVAHAVAGLLLLRAAIAAYLGGASPNRRMVALGVGLGVLGVLVSPDRALGLAVMGGALTLALTPVLWLSALIGLVVVGAVLVGLLGGDVAGGFSFLYGAALLTFTCRVSVWMLKLGWEIDKSARSAPSSPSPRSASDSAATSTTPWAATCPWSPSRASSPLAWRNAGMPLPRARCSTYAESPTSRCARCARS
jgi:two-component system sensor histidine kinase DesK